MIKTKQKKMLNFFRGRRKTNVPWPRPWASLKIFDCSKIFLIVYGVYLPLQRSDENVSKYLFFMGKGTSPHFLPSRQYQNWKNDELTFVFVPYDVAEAFSITYPNSCCSPTRLRPSCGRSPAAPRLHSSAFPYAYPNILIAR